MDYQRGYVQLLRCRCTCTPSARVLPSSSPPPPTPSSMPTAPTVTAAFSPIPLVLSRACLGVWVPLGRHFEPYAAINQRLPPYVVYGNHDAGLPIKRVSDSNLQAGPYFENFDPPMRGEMGGLVCAAVGARHPEGVWADGRRLWHSRTGACTCVVIAAFGSCFARQHAAGLAQAMVRCVGCCPHPTPPPPTFPWSPSRA